MCIFVQKKTMQIRDEREKIELCLSVHSVRVSMNIYIVCKSRYSTCIYIVECNVGAIFACWFFLNEFNNEKLKFTNIESFGILLWKKNHFIIKTLEIFLFCFVFQDNIIIIFCLNHQRKINEEKKIKTVFAIYWINGINSLEFGGKYNFYV